MKNSGINSELFNAFSKLKVMIVGDVMTDAYIFGKVDRISPEAPVPVVHITRREMRPGGAANVAINIIAMGAAPVLCSVTGDDSNADEFISLLQKEKINTQGIVKAPGRKTTVKTRVIGNNHQLVRVDDESVEPISESVASKFISLCESLLVKEKPDVLIFEDYDKGVLTSRVISSITSKANELNIPIAVDPKRKNFNDYRGVTLFKPNLHELRTGLNITLDKVSPATLNESVKVFFNERGMDMVMVTLSESGVFIADQHDGILIPAHVRNISDVSGAGDTVISVAALCLAAGLPKESIAALSNLAGGLVCEMVGVVPIDRQKLFEEAEKIPLQLEIQKS